jgi:hypothetical protein
MATLHMITENQFRTSRFAQLADQVDGDLSEIIAQAESYIEALLSRRFDERPYTDRTRVPVTSCKVFLEQRPITELTTIQRRADNWSEWETLDPAAFTVYADEGYLEADFLDLGGYEYRVTYCAGFATGNVPKSVQAAVMIQTALLIYQDLELYGVGDSKNPGVLYLEDQVKMYLRPFCRVKL